jgi:glycosyltransferase involved in cell wall biosynthesis
MKVLHAFTLQSPDNAFGGPIRVALNLGHELESRGVEVQLVGGCRSYEITPTQIENIPAHLFPVSQIHSKLGFSGLISFKLLTWAWRNVKNYDLVHIHMARDLITLPIGLICRMRRIPFVIQGHGMIDPTEKFAGRLLDNLFVKRLLKKSAKLLYLTQQEAKDYPAVAGKNLTNLVFMPNGVPAQTEAAPNRESTSSHTVSYISRLQARKRPHLFVQMASRLVNDGIDCQFKIAGADEGELAPVLHSIKADGLTERFEYLGSQDHAGVIELLNKTSVLVLPSINEPFPMIILEAISCAIPVVITDTCGLAPYITRGNAGVVTDGSVGKLAAATQLILNDLPKYSANALTLAENEFSMARIGDELISVYHDAIKAI